jgi:hydrogenase maturation protease
VRRVPNLRIVGVGNPWRGDDAAGLVVARRLEGTLPPGVAALERAGEPTGLLDAWDGADAVWLVDAVSSGVPAGTVHRLDASEHELPAHLFRTSTHQLGLAEIVELGRALGRLPRQLVVYGVEGGSFEAGARLTPEVELAAGTVARAVREEVELCTRGR